MRAGGLTRYQRRQRPRRPVRRSCGGGADGRAGPGGRAASAHTITSTTVMKYWLVHGRRLTRHQRQLRQLRQARGRVRQRPRRRCWRMRWAWRACPPRRRRPPSCTTTRSGSSAPRTAWGCVPGHVRVPGRHAGHARTAAKLHCSASGVMHAADCMGVRARFQESKNRVWVRLAGVLLIVREAASCTTTRSGVSAAWSARGCLPVLNISHQGLGMAGRHADHTRDATVQLRLGVRRNARA